MSEQKTQTSKTSNSITRGMPSNIEAEQAVLCSILIDKDAADALIPRLLPDDFYSNKNRIIFEAMKEIQDESNPIDTVALTDRLVVNGKLDEVGSVSYISSLSMAVPSSANCEYYLEMVKRDGLLRRIIGTGNDIVKKAYASDDATEMLNYAESKIFSIGENKDKMALATISSAACKAFDEISDIQKGKAQQEKLSTGFKQLDRHLFGMKPGEFILIAARPSVGKTALALNIACDVAIEQHKKVAIFSMEMSSVLLAKRVLAHLSKVSLTASNKKRGLSNESMDALYRAAKRLDSAEIFIDDYSLNTPGDILAKCRRIKREKGLDLVVIDYLQLMSMDGGRYSDNRQQEVSTISRLMKLYAGELKVPILVLSQMSRDFDKRTKTEREQGPKLSDLRDSGAIEQDADVVMFLHRLDENDRTKVDLIVAKNRNGPCGTIHLHWQGDTTTFSEIEDMPVPKENLLGGVTAVREGDEFSGADADDFKGEPEEK